MTPLSAVTTVDMCADGSHFPIYTAVCKPANSTIFQPLNAHAMTLQVTLVTTPEELQIAKNIRLQVFVQEQGFSEVLQFDEYDDHPLTRHFLGKDVEQDKYVATTRCLLTPELRKAKVGRVAVLKECRGKNYGVALILGTEEKLASEADSFMLSSQYDKRGFYAKCGYECMSDEVYLEQNVEHCMMIKTTKT